MRYFSTRSKNDPVTASQAILAGIAPDGGLYVPEYLPLTDFSSWRGQSYQETAEKLFSIFLTDFSSEAIADIVNQSYGDSFDTEAITPIHPLDSGLAVLELWHGPTLAFKDMALQALPHLFSQARAIQCIEDRFLILTATSGDTGKAAMSGFSGNKDSLVAVFYPDGGVSELQELQMLTPGHPNVKALALDGSFDDCQREVKRLMRDQVFLEELKRHSLRLTSANSINMGRLIPQMVYYIQAYLQTVPVYGDLLSVIVPSGNVGNILAARYAKAMGLPLGEIRLVSNSNKVLYDFLKSGFYDARRELVKTSSPSMDILVASNMERYLHLLTGDEELLVSLMEALQKEGHFFFNPTLFDLAADWASEAETKETIRDIYATYAYLVDPHTAVALRSARVHSPQDPCLVVSTASPYKFTHSVLEALDLEPPDGVLEQIQKLQGLAGVPLPRGLDKLFQQIPGHKTPVSPEDMTASLWSFIEDNHEKS